MQTLNNFLTKNESTLSVIRWIIIPILFAASFFVLDSRYMSKAEWATSVQLQNSAISQLASEQKQSFNKLTDAISVLANEQRNVVEYEHATTITQEYLARLVAKRDIEIEIAKEQQNKVNERVDSRLNALEIVTTRHDVQLGQKK